MDGVENRSGRGARWWWLYLAPSLAAVSSAFGGVALGYAVPLIGKTNAQPDWVWGGALGLFLGVGLTIATQVNASKREKMRRKGVINFNDALSDVQRAVATLLRSRSDREAKERFFSTVVTKGSALFSIDGVRVCIYELDEADEEAADKQYLRLVDFGGRPDEPRTEFRADTEHGKAAIKLANGTTHVRIPDPKRSKYPVDRHPSAIWKSFAAVPLRDQHSPRGMLTVDTREKTVFTTEDMVVAQTLGTFLVLGMTELAEAANETAPEMKAAADRLHRLRQNDRGDGYSQDEGEVITQ